MRISKFLTAVFFGLLFVNYIYAQCGTSAGTMSSTQTIHICIDQCTDGLTHNGDEVLDPGDVFQFIIHDGSTPVNIIARNNTPEFCYQQLVGVSSGETYYISAVAGPPDENNNVDETHICYSQSPGTPVVWYDYPSAHITTNNQNICGSEFTIVAQEPSSGYTGTWSADGGFVATGGTTVNSPTINVLANNYEEITFTWTVTDGVCPSSDDVTLTFIQVPSANAGSNFSVCGNEAQLDASFSLSNTTGQWSGPGTFSPQTDPDATVSVNSYGSHTFTWRETNVNCYDESTVTVTFVQEPNPSIIMDYDSVCGNNYNLVATNSNFSGQWTAYHNGSPVTPNPILNTSSPTTTASIGEYTELSKTVEFFWIETNSGGGITCRDTANITVTFAKQPSSMAGDPNVYELCGNSYTFNASGSEWATGTWTAPNVIATYDDRNSPSATVVIDSLGSFGDSAHVEVPFVWAVTNYGCSVLDTMWVTFYQRPTANAGLDNAVCGNEYQLGAVYSLPDSENHTAQGVWTVAERPFTQASADWTTPNNADSAWVNVSHYGEWTFRFREENAFLTSCYSTDTVKIEFVEIPIVDAGDDKHVCGQSTVMEGTSSTGFSGSWLPNGAQFDDPSDPTTAVSVNTYGWLDFVWSESNTATTTTLSCNARDTVSIRFWRQPNAKILTDDEDSTACGLFFNHLRAQIPPSGITGSWYNETDPDPVYGNVNSHNTNVTVSSYGYHDFYWIEANGPAFIPDFCNDTAGPLRIHFIERPNANAGGDTLFCGKTGYLSAIPSVGTGVWSTPSSELITFENENNPNTLITSEIFSGSTNPYFNLIWTEDNTNECTDRDTIKVRFGRIPNSAINIVPPKCAGEQAILSAQEDSLQQYDWNFSGGIIDTTNIGINPQGGNYEYFVHWFNEDTAHRVSLVVTNSWGCQSSITIDSVFEPTIPDFDVILVGDTCLLDKGGIVFEDTLGQSAFYWLNDEIGPPLNSPITAVYNLPVGEYDIRARYRTPNTFWSGIYNSVFGNDRCTDTVRYEIEPIGLLHAEFEVPLDVLTSELVAPEAEVWFNNSSDYGGVNRRCVWHFGDGNTLISCDEQVYHTYTEPGCYEPFLIVMNRDLQQCRDTALIDFCIEIDSESSIEVPNVFTPDGDGINDYFQVKGQSIRTFSGYIVNRWGDVVYEWTNWQDEDAGWDGRNRGGTDAAPGVYYYIIRAVGMDDVEFEKHGHLHLIR